MYVLPSRLPTVAGFQFRGWAERAEPAPESAPAADGLGSVLCGTYELLNILLTCGEEPIYCKRFLRSLLALWRSAF